MVMQQAAFVFWLGVQSPSRLEPVQAGLLLDGSEISVRAKFELAAAAAQAMEQLHDEFQFRSVIPVAA
jgi:hypothetical protein